jgi:acetylxylan esterase
MKRFSSIAAILCGLLVASSAWAASLTEVPRATWAGSVSLPSYLKMYIYVPDKVAANPPLVVSLHACGSTASGQMDNMKKFKAMADKNGFIMILPDNPGQNCWDVGSKQAMTHDGGGDPHGIAQMVRYALTKYNGDKNRVYAVGGSSGGMMTQGLLGIYPELFIAGAPRAGVPCGCWAESYASSNQWSGPCAGGSVSKSPQQWGDYVRAINPTYTGHRPRVQIFQGENDQTISFKNFGESIKEWTNVLNLNTKQDDSDKISVSGYTYNRKFWKNKCGYRVLEAWSAPGQPHSMTYEEDSIMKFFGIDAANAKDPELAACGESTVVAYSEEGVSPVSVRPLNDGATIYSLNGKIIAVVNSPNRARTLSIMKGGNVYLVYRKSWRRARYMVLP